jgi:hypothetical protein
VPDRLVVRVLVAGVNGGSLRALEYARSLGVADTRAVSFAFDAEEAAKIEREWIAAGISLPLDLSDAPYRDVGDPLLHYLRKLTADEGTAVNVVMPEIVVRGWARVLHNQRALYIKRLLLFEPGDPLERSVPALPITGVPSALVPRRRQSHGLERVLGAPALLRPRTATSARRSTTRSA